MRTLAEAIDQFVYHPATEQTAPLHAAVRSTVIGLVKAWWNTLPEGPEKTLALRKLQEAAMYANLAIALLAPSADPATDAVPRTLLADVSDEDLVREYRRRVSHDTGKEQEFDEHAAADYVQHVHEITEPLA